jgi:hypothetical protein
LAIHAKGYSGARAKGGRSCGGTRYYQSKRRGEDNLVKYLAIKQVLPKVKPLSPIEKMDLYLIETTRIINNLFKKYDIK